MPLENFQRLLDHLQNKGFSFVRGGRYPSKKDIFISGVTAKQIETGNNHFFALPIFDSFEAFPIYEMTRKKGAVYFIENPTLDKAFVVTPVTGGPYLEMFFRYNDTPHMVSGWISLRSRFLMDNLEYKKPSARLEEEFKELRRVSTSLMRKAKKKVEDLKAPKGTRRKKS